MSEQQLVSADPNWGGASPASGPEGSALSRFASGAWKNLNPMGLVTAAQHPIETAKALIDAQAAQLEKAKQAYKDGHYSEAIGHLGASALPLVGPPAANAGERIGAGDVAGGLGEATGLIGSIEAPRAIGMGMKGSARLLQSPLVARFAKPAATMIGSKVGGPAGAVVGSAVGEALAARAMPKPPIEAPPVVAVPGVDRYMPNVSADPAPVAPPETVPVAPAAAASAVPPSTAPPPASPPSDAAAQLLARLPGALSDQEALAVDGLVRQGVPKEEALAAVQQYRAQPPATTPAPPVPKLTVAEFQEVQKMIRSGKASNLADAMQKMQAAKELAARLGLSTPTVADTKFPKGMRGGSQPLKPLP